MNASITPCLFHYLKPDWSATISATDVLSLAPLKLFVRLGFSYDITKSLLCVGARGFTRDNHGCRCLGQGGEDYASGMLRTDGVMSMTSFTTEMTP